MSDASAIRRSSTPRRRKNSKSTTRRLAEGSLTVGESDDGADILVAEGPEVVFRKSVGVGDSNHPSVGSGVPENPPLLNGHHQPTLDDSVSPPFNSPHSHLLIPDSKSTNHTNCKVALGEYKAADTAIHRKVDWALGHLSSEIQVALDLSFGLTKGFAENQQQVADELNKDADQIQRLVDEGLRSLFNPPRK